MTKRLKIISVVNIIALIIALLILRFSEIYRGQNPLYVTLKMVGWALFFCSVLASLINTLFIIFDKSNLWEKKLLWIIVSLLPILYFFTIIVLSFINTNL
jgi:ABC-type methionine transport system permease subunit